MTNNQLKNLKDRLWEGADQLRANSGLKSTEYATPILGLIFLRFAQGKYAQFEDAIVAEYKGKKGKRDERKIHEIAVEKCGFYLPPEAKFDYLLNLPESENLAEKTKSAMEEIEKYTAELADTLPKDAYYNVNSVDDPQVLAKLFQDYSLNPGRHIGVVIEDDGLTEEEFKTEMRRLNLELAKLNAEARELERTIADNLRSLVD
jgi:type I restriction enzyme M protein